MKSNGLRTAIIVILACSSVVTLNLLLEQQQESARKDATDQVAVIALSFGAAIFIAAAVIGLLRRTRDMPASARLRFIAQLAYSAMAGIMPSRRAMAAPAGGCLAFLGVFLTGLAATRAIINLISPEVPHPTEVSDALGNFMRVLLASSSGATCPFCWH